MPVKTKIKPDVFISHAASDWVTASRLRRQLADFDIRAVYHRRKAGVEWQDMVWRSLDEADAVIILLTEAGLKSPWITFEAGAAAGRQKSVYVVRFGVLERKIPKYLRRYRQFRWREVEKLAKSIQNASRPLSLADRRQLMERYAQLGVPSDRLLREPSVLDSLTEAFNRATGKALAPERVLQELIKLRKRAMLPVVRRKSKKLHKRRIRLKKD